MYKSEYSFIWKIKNFSFCHQKNGQSLHSPTFFAEILSPFEWFLELYPRGTNRKNTDCISCFVCTPNDTSEIDFEIEIIGVNGKSLKLLASKKSVLDEFGNPHLRCYSADFFTIKEVVQDSENGAKDTLTVFCRIFGKSSIPDSSDGCIAYTKIGVDSFSFKLKAHDEHGLKKSKHTVNLEPTNNFKFYVTKTLGSMKVHVSKLKSSVDMDCYVDCRITLMVECEECASVCIGTNAFKKYSQRATHYFHRSRFSNTWEFPYEMPVNEVLKAHRKHLPFLEIYFYFEFSCSNGMELVYLQNKTESNSHLFYKTKARPYNSLQVDFLNLFISKKYCDVKLRVDDQVIEAHKNVLVARSPVFDIMFEQDMIEAQTGIVDIVDIDVRTLTLFLEFLYTGTVIQLDYEDAKCLILAAEKYQVPSLKQKCSKFLKTEISIDNVCEILSLADKVDLLCLKQTSIDFIITNSEKVLLTPQWLTWVEDNSELASIIFSRLTVNRTASMSYHIANFFRNKFFQTNTVSG